ncbi:hypothetical protein DMN91_004784 [Ooceraea biroi]|uniref:CCHC-type domain-containing protein n=1 Tax=Ooceraea biroi TaxID=2015173 RepID=A0A3L8DQF3_OOCBI|nr:uncharacterized protein LOC105287185 isoform X1 [Ooceraea biroi]RLU22506.1 hypothetical protein DMN91_004784 [Ooceraea biroi]
MRIRPQRGGQNKQDIQASRTSKIRYSYSDKPPYSVFIQPTVDNKESFVHPLTISRVLSTITPIELIEVKKTGRGRVVADFRTFSAANSVINHPELTKLKLKAYIPEFKVLRSGIIKDVPQSLDMATMIKHMESSIEVRHEVTPFLPKTRICYACFRVGHVSSSCKGKPRCMVCGKDKHTESNPCLVSNETPICVNCSGGHLPTYPFCPAVIQHKKITALAAAENISFSDAKRRIQGTSFNTRINPVYDFRNFPILPGSTSFPTSNGDQVPYNNRFSPLQSFQEPDGQDGYSYAAATAYRRPAPLPSTFVPQPSQRSHFDVSRKHSAGHRPGAPAPDILYPNGRPPSSGPNGVALQAQVQAPPPRADLFPPSRHLGSLSETHGSGTFSAPDLGFHPRETHVPGDWLDSIWRMIQTKLEEFVKFHLLPSLNIGQFLLNSVSDNAVQVTQDSNHVGYD